MKGQRWQRWIKRDASWTYKRIEYQISNSGFSAVANVGPSMYCVVSTLPLNAHSGTCLCNPNDLTANWNSQHSFPYNSINCAPNLGNGQLCQVYQGERSVHGVSSLWGSHNIPQVPAMALQLAGVTLVPALTPQMAGGNVHTGAPPWFEATQENQLNIQGLLGQKGERWRWQVVKSDCDANWPPNFGSMAAKRNLEKNMRVRNKNYPMWRVILRCQLGYSLISANTWQSLSSKSLCILQFLLCPIFSIFRLGSFCRGD